MSGMIFLVGPMGAGKTTIGKRLASELKLPFVDSDQEIEERAGADIPWIFDVEGEAGFREREHKVLADICSGGTAVVATGGGIIEREDNRNLLAASGKVVYLCSTVEQQLKRTGKDKSRPLLNNGNPEEVLTELMERRDPLYRELATVVHQTDDRSPRLAAAEIAKLVSESSE